MTDDPHAEAWGWVAHLLDGGVTPWTSYAGGTAAAAGERLPGAQQLELLRRINMATGGRSPGAGAIIRASLAGRGRPEHGLIGITDVRPGIEPSELPDSELLRVAASAIADGLIVGGLPEPVEPPPARRRRRHFNLVGDPWLAIPLRDELTQSGHPPGGPRSATYVLGGRFDHLVVNAWSAACFDNGPAPWETWLAKWVERDRPPARVDLVKIAGRHRPRARSVDLVLDPALLRGLLGVRRRLALPGPLSVHALEMARRVAVVLGGLVSPEERKVLLRSRLLPVLAAFPGPRLALPEPHAIWALSQSQRMRAELTEAGYPVHGSWDEVEGPPGGVPGAVPMLDRPTEAGALKVALSVLGKEDLGVVSEQ